MLNVAARRASGLINMNLTRGRPLQTVFLIKSLSAQCLLMYN
jgi:hypothetical protein